MENNNGNHPANYKEKKLFKQELAKDIRKKEDNPEIDEDEENFEEAAKAVNTVLVKTSIPDSTKCLIEDQQAINISSESSNFWILVHALRDFVAREQRLPVI